MILFPLAMLLAAQPEITVSGRSPVGEIGYEAGSLGYDALMRKDYAEARRQLLTVSVGDREDSAWLINYGQTLAKAGRIKDAEAAFRKAAKLRDGDLILADGREMASEKAAAEALASLRRSAGIATASR